MTVLLVTGLVAASGAVVGATTTDQTVEVDYDAVLQPGEQTTITVNGTDASEIRINGEVGGWVVNSTTPSSLTTFPNSEDTPYTSQSGDSWGHLFASAGNNTFSVTVIAPEATGTYNLSASVANDNTSVSENFTIKVTETDVSVDHEETVTVGTQTTVTVNGTHAGDLRVTGDVGGWTVNETSPATLTTSPAETPNVTRDGGVWGHVYSTVGNHSFEVTVTPPNATGTYDFTAEAVGTNTSVAESFSIEVTEPAQAPEGVTQETYDAATGGDGELSREDILNVVQQYLRGEPIGQDIDITREELLALVQAYITG